MKTLEWSIAEGLSPRGAIASARTFSRRALDAGAAASLYCASFASEAVVLGRWQVAEQALVAEEASRVRRWSGGPATQAGPGVAYFSLGYRATDAPMDTPPGQTLNRGVRGMLRGLSSLGCPVHYFGREFLSAQKRPVASCSWGALADGSVVIDFFVGVSSSAFPRAEHDGYAPRATAAMLGKLPTSLSEMGALTTLSAMELATAIVSGHEAAFGFSAARARDSELTSVEVPPEHARALEWSRPREVPIGYVTTGAHFEDDSLADVQLGGDILQGDAAHERFREALLRRSPTASEVRDAINVAYGAPGAIEGVRSLDPLLSSVLELLSRANTPA